jgi:hypothetical protein
LLLLLLLLLLIEYQVVVVGATKQAVVTQSELIAGNQLPAAGDTPEASHVINEVSRTHHQVGNAKAELAPGAFCTKQPAKFEITRHTTERVQKPRSVAITGRLSQTFQQRLVDAHDQCIVVSLVNTL